jgi:preprotein translocase subunit YajC
MSVLTHIVSSEGGGSGAFLQFGILLLIPVAMYFLMIRPQRRRMREQAELQSSLDVGDEVITTAGIYGFITGFDGDKVWIEVDDDVQIRVARAAVQGKVDTAEPAAEAATDSGTDADADSDA